MENWYNTEIVYANLEENKMQELCIETKRIVIFRRNQSVLAFSATCPHAGAFLSEGFVDALGRVVCPLHHYRFDPQNGRNTSGEGYKLFCYATEIRGGIVYVRLIR